MEYHAPEQNYMLIDGRHDHSFRLPRPDLSQSFDSPNACNLCHQNRKPEWTAAAMDKWYGKLWRERPHYGTVLHAAVTQGLKALPSLIELAKDLSKPAIVRATAIQLSQPMVSQELLLARDWLKHPAPSLRSATLELFENIDPGDRVQAISPLLTDPIRLVRMEAARVLADVPTAQLPAEKRNVLASAIQEYRTYLALNADWPTENVNLGNLELRLSNLDAAIKAYQRALSLDPKFAGAYVNLADAYRQSGRDNESEKYLRQGLAVLPMAADLHHALGLALIRKADHTEALAELAEAAKLAPDNDRYAYVYGIGLHSSGNAKQALAVLKAADAVHPFNLDILQALISINLQTGNGQEALAYARKAAEVMPDNAELNQLIRQLESAK